MIEAMQLVGTVVLLALGAHVLLLLITKGKKEENGD